MRRLTAILGAALVVMLTATPGLAQDKPAKAKAPAVSVATPVNLNTATATELQALPGIGARTAQMIIEHRQKSGGFKKVEELMNIKGIGEKSFLKLKPMVTVGPGKADGKQ